LIDTGAAEILGNWGGRSITTSCGDIEGMLQLVELASPVAGRSGAPNASVVTTPCSAKCRISEGVVSPRASMTRA
jgi:hypothetical protein